MYQERKFALGPVGLICMAGTVAMLVAMLPVPLALVPGALVPEARAADECGASSAFVARYTAHSTSTSYSEGDFVTTGTGANLKIWEAGSTISGTTTAPTTAAPAGWADVTTQYAANKVVCDSSDTLSSTTDVDYDDADLQIEFDRSGVTVNSITHTGTGGEIYLKAGAVSRAAATGVNIGVFLNSATSADLLRVTMDSGTSVTNLDGTSGSHAIDVRGGTGGAALSIAGSTTAATRADAHGGNSAINVYTPGGSIDIDITGGTHTSGGGGGGGIAVGASLWQASADMTVGAGSIDIDISGASTVLTAPGVDGHVVHPYGRAGAISVTIGTGSTVCAGTYSSGTCTGYSGRSAVFLGRQFTAGTSTFTNSGNIYGNVGASRSATATATNSGNIYGGLTVNGMTTTVTLSAGSTIANSAGASASNALFALGETGGIDLDIAGSTSAAARAMGDTGGGSAAILASSIGGSIDIDITGGTHTAGGGGGNGVALVTSLYQPSTDPTVGTGSTDIDISGASTVLAAPGVDGHVVSLYGRAGAISVTIGTGSTICAGTYSAGACTGYSGSSAMFLDRQFIGMGTTTFTNSGNIYGNVNFRSAATSTATHSGNIFGLLGVYGTTVTVTLNAGSTITNAEEASASHALVGGAGTGGVDMDIAGSTTSAARASGDSGAGNSAILAFSIGGSIDIDITGGTHTAGGGGNQGVAVLTSLWQASTDPTVGTGTIDIDISGANTVLTAPGAHASVVFLYGRAGADSVTVGTGSTICAGTYSAGACTDYSGKQAINFDKQFVNVGTSTFTNSGTVYGSLFTLQAATSAIINQAGGQLFGAVTSGVGASTFTNRGTWTMIGHSDFGAGTDTFTNTGTATLVIQSSGTAGAFVRNLETFTLQAAGPTESAGIIRFSLETNALPSFSAPLLELEDATLSLAGVVEVIARSGGSLPSTGALYLLGAHKLTPTTDISDLSLSAPLQALGSNVRLMTAVGKLILSFGDVCGSSTSRTLVAPGRATSNLVCSRADSLTTSTNVMRLDDNIAILYRGDAAPVRSILNTGMGGEIHIESGSVLVPANDPSTRINAVQLGAAPVVGSGSTSSHVRMLALIAATQAEGTLTAAQVYARDNAIRLTTAAGTMISNRKAAGNDEFGSAIRVNGWGAHINMEIAGDTYSEYTGIRVTNDVAGDTNIRILGGTHRSNTHETLYVWTSPQNLRPSGTIDVDITGNARLSHGGTDLQRPGTSNPNAVIRISAATSYRHNPDDDPIPDDRLHTLDIGPNAVICRGTFSSEGVCRPRSNAVAIFVSASGTEPQMDSRGNPVPRPIHQITNEGQIYGDIVSSGNTRGVRITNRGSIFGHYTSLTAGTVSGAGDSDGPDIVVNENGGLWVMERNSDFRRGSDSFTNHGTLVFRYSGTTIDLQNLEAFTQTTGGVMRVEIDPRGSDPNDDTHDGLPPVGSALVDVGRAVGILAGTIEVVVLNTLPRASLIPLITALGTNTMRNILIGNHQLSVQNAEITLGAGVATRGAGDAFVYDLLEIPTGVMPTMDQVVRTITAPDDRAAAHTYDSVIQVSLFAAHAILNSMATSECAVKTSFSQRSSHVRFERENCTWLNLGARRTTHERTTQGAKDTEEIAANLSGGVQMPLGDSGWGFSATAAYEYSDMDVGRGSSEGHRLLGGLILSSMADGGHWNWRFAATGQISRYEVERFANPTTLGLRPSTARPDVITVAVHGGMERVFSRTWESLGSWSVVPRLEIDVTGFWMGKFTEVGSRLQVGETRGILVSGTPSVEVRHAGETLLGLVQSWLEIGAVSFATDPRINYEISRGSTSRIIEGTLERVLGEVSVGVNLVRKGGTEFSFFFDGLMGADTFIGGVTLKAKYAF